MVKGYRWIAALTLSLAACGPVPATVASVAPSPVALMPAPTAIPLVPASLAPGTVRLPTNGGPLGGGCLGVGFDDGILRGDPTDSHLAWVQTRDVRVEVYFPLGFVGRFDPTLEVIAPNGSVVAHDGDPIDGGCWTVGDGPVVILADPSHWPKPTRTGVNPSGSHA